MSLYIVYECDHCHRREEIKLTERSNLPTPPGWSEWIRETKGIQGQSRIRQICPWCDVEFEGGEEKDEPKDTPKNGDAPKNGSKERASEEKPEPTMVRRIADGRIYYATQQPGGEWYLRPTIGDRTMMYVSPDHFRIFYRNLEDTLPAALDGQWHKVLDERDWRIYEAQYVVEQECELWKVRGVEPDRGVRSFTDELFQKRFRRA
jgi:hypothetical protein